MAAESARTSNSKGIEGEANEDLIKIDSELNAPNSPTTSAGTGSAPVAVKDENSINLATVKKILYWWGATVPVALFVSFAITSLLLIGQPAYQGCSV